MFLHKNSKGKNKQINQKPCAQQSKAWMSQDSQGSQPSQRPVKNRMVSTLPSHPLCSLNPSSKKIKGLLDIGNSPAQRIIKWALFFLLSPGPFLPVFAWLASLCWTSAQTHICKRLANSLKSLLEELYRMNYTSFHKPRGHLRPLMLSPGGRGKGLYASSGNESFHSDLEYWWEDSPMRPKPHPSFNCPKQMFPSDWQENLYDLDKYHIHTALLYLRGREGCYREVIPPATYYSKSGFWTGNANTIRWASNTISPPIPANRDLHFP